MDRREDRLVSNVLEDDIGFIELVDSMGNDLTVVNSARVSFGKRKTDLDEADVKLISYLAKNKHWSPFRHIVFQFHIKAPEIVARQLYKHVVGCEYAFKDQPWNEISGRYVVYEEEFYFPKKWRKQSASNKQASTDEQVDDPNSVDSAYQQLLDDAYGTYKNLLEKGVSKEQARLCLPVSFYTEWYFTATAQAIANLIKLRDTSHAQWESRQFAIAMKDLVMPVAEKAMSALIEYM